MKKKASVKYLKQDESWQINVNILIPKTDGNLGQVYSHKRQWKESRYIAAKRIYMISWDCSV